MAETEPPASHIATAEAFENIRVGLNRLGTHFISTRTALDTREKLLEEKEARFRSKESELEAIEEAITGKLLDFDELKKHLESIEGLIGEKENRVSELEGLIREKEKEFGLLRNQERELDKRLSSREKSVNVSLEKLDCLAKNVEECVNEAKRRERELERREREVEELRNDVELKEKGLCEKEARLVEENKRAVDSVIKAAEESVKVMEERVRDLTLRAEELKTKEMELKRQVETLKMCREPLEHARIASSVTNLVSCCLKAKKPGTSTADNAGNLHPLNLEAINDGNMSGFLNGNNLKQNAHPNIDAIYLALEWKEYMMGNIRNSVEGFAFLLFLATYGILNSLTTDEIVNLLGLVSQNKRALKLCQAPALAVGITDLVRNLIDNKRLHDAVKYVSMFKLSDKVPPAPILEKYVDEVMKCSAATCGLRIAPGEKVRLLENQIANARALVQCIKDHSPEYKHPSNVIEIQIALLESLKEKWRCLLPNVCPGIVAQQKQRKRRKHDGSISATETLSQASQQPRKVKFVFGGSRTQ